ncbi:MAG: cysteine desulfurase [Patescibacteria group bacterium]
MLLPDMRKDFPIFKKQPALVYLDSAATSLKPQCVIDAMDEYYGEYSANVHRGLYAMSERATQAYEGARQEVKKFLNAASEKEVIFTRGTTEAINLVAYAWGNKWLKEGDEIILTVLEHHSNIVPWQMLAKRKKCHLKFLDVDSHSVLQLDKLSDLMTRRTKMLAISHVSNALGTITSLRPIIQKAHAISAKVLVDAAQSAPHLPLDVQYLDCDFLAFSGHKMCGPTGIGVLYAKEKMLETMDPFMGGGDMIREVHQTSATWNDLPWKFEAGTPPIAEAIGLGRAIQYLREIGLSNIRRHEKKLLTHALSLLGKIPDLQLFGPCDPEIQSSVISFGVKGIHPHDIAAILDTENIAIRAGHHCCMPLMERMKIQATARASFYLYNTEEDIEKLASGIKKVKKIFKV